MANMLNESRMFSEALNSKKIQDRLFGSSVSAEDARIRQGEYSKMFSRYNDLKKEYQKLFSGYAETPLLSTQYFNATVAAYVSSFAGFMSIERDMDQPNGLFYWMDVLGVTDGREVMPNIGKDDFDQISVMGRVNGEAEVVAGAAQAFMIGKKVMPGSLKIRIVHQDKSEDVLVDNGKGMLIAEAGVLKAMAGGEANINYMSGNVKFECGTALTNGQDRIIYVCAEDGVGEPSLQESNPAYTGPAYNRNRFVAKLKQIPMGTVPDMLTAEYNISALAAMKKATNTDIASFMFSKLRDLYSKLINYRLVKTLEAGYTGLVMPIDLTANNGFHDYRSYLDLFAGQLVNVETALASKAVKGVTTTAYVVGTQVASVFQKMTAIGKFERNEKSTYITDLLGWYDGVPVLRSIDIPVDMGYAIHKTADGQLAPLARGIYLPLTDTPAIGNYNNVTQLAQGIYYQEGIRSLAPELVQAFQVTSSGI